MLDMACICRHSLVTLYLYILLPFIFLSAVHLSFLSHLLISKYLLPSSWQEFDWFLLGSPLQTVAAHEVVCALVGSVSVSASECFFSLCVWLCDIYSLQYTDQSLHRSISCSYFSVVMSCTAFVITTVIHRLAKDYKSHDYPPLLTLVTTTVFSFTDSSVVCLISVVCVVFLMKY